MRCRTWFLSLGSSCPCVVGLCPPGEGGWDVKRQAYRLRVGRLPGGGVIVLCLERGAESRSVEIVELAGEGILGRRNSVG